MIEYTAFRKYPARIERADKHAKGMIALAAAQFCQPFTSSNEMGYLLSLPYGLEFEWRGGLDISQRVYGVNKEELRASLTSASPEGEQLKIVDVGFDFGCLVIQILTGLVISTPSGYWLAIIPPANENRMSPEPATQSAILETDWWRGELQVNINIRLQNHKVVIPPNTPIAKLLIIPKDLLGFNKGEPKYVEDGRLIQEWRDWHYKQEELGRSAYRQASIAYATKGKSCPHSSEVSDGNC
ncbi:DUF6065 family protein [Deinococcus sp. DB0503]|uniref:DUF6065 family protein n=1 Tax=Deinococcus sp. DB0503 TaxID=2479203 RepID=UPI002105B3EF|nr:DUF6065 family protein [Deinococcus sp. DB0503]